MLEWFTVLGLIVFGIILIIVEIVFIPGTTIVGILGCIFGLSGLYLSFEYFGNTVGIIISVISVGISLAAIVISLKNGVWDRFSLKSAIDSKVNQEYIIILNVGDVGKAVSTLRPMGNAIFGEKIIEVRTNGDYIPADTDIRIAKIDDSRIYVESIIN